MKNNNDNVHLPCTHQCPEHSHNTYYPKYNILYTRRVQSYQNNLHKVLYGNTHTHAHTHIWMKNTNELWIKHVHGGGMVGGGGCTLDTWNFIWLLGVHRICTEVAVFSWGTSHVTAKHTVRTPLQQIFKIHCVKLQWVIQLHVTAAQWVCQSWEQRYIKKKNIYIYHSINLLELGCTRNISKCTTLTLHHIVWPWTQHPKVPRTCSR